MIKKSKDKDVIRLVYWVEKFHKPAWKILIRAYSPDDEPTHPLKKDRERRQATVCVTRKVHKRNQANSQTETRQATVSPEESTLKNRPTHQLKQDRPQFVSPEECIIKQMHTT